MELESDPMNLSHSQRRWTLLGSLFSLLLLLMLFGFNTFRHNPNRGLPYHDSFAKGEADEWKALGGSWELTNGAMRNDSDERGAKLLTGSPYWHNYSIEADVYLMGASGDAGLIIRSSNEEEGVNSYSGYYAGIRTLDNALVLGRAQYGWMEVNRQSPTPGGIRPFQWYHLKLLAYDCQVVATASTQSQTILTSLAITDPSCVTSGRVGFRSYSSGGIWRKVVVHPATHSDLVQMLRDDGASKVSVSTSQQREPFDLPFRPEEVEANAIPGASARSIASLLLDSFAIPATATVRGVVVLTEPRLIVQDSTGGAYIPQPTALPLKVGDEVEVRGEVHPGNFSSTIEHANVRVLWASTPMPPVSVTASQASTGRFDATFIEVQGRLTGREHGPDNTLVLDLDEGPQSFRAILNSRRSEDSFDKLKLNSTLRIRGVCIVDSAFTNSLTPFVLLLHSNEDVKVLAGPPWWSAGHVIAIVIAFLLLALVATFVYHRIAHWRLQGVLEERQRLAHEMHDSLAQSFAGIGFQLQAIRNGVFENDSRVLQQLDLAADLVRHSHEEARRSIAAIQLESLEIGDLLTALDFCARRMVEGGAVHVFSEREGDQRPLPLRIADTMYRIGQEAIANAVRHAKPTVLTIRLKFSEDSACLQIEDNGVGFVQGNSLLSFGIRGMRRRAQSISAALQIETEPSRGTRVKIVAPLPPRATLITWPKLFWRHMKERWFDARPSQHADSHSYRG
jgi:signal transduction histidine kinase